MKKITKILLNFSLMTALTSFAQSASNNDPLPSAPKPPTPNNGITQQAGIGSNDAFARAGVLELGGAGGYTSNSDLTEIDFSPSIGWFFMNNWQASFILNYAYADIDGLGDSQTLTALVEPSFHYPLTDRYFAFLGVGAGVNYKNLDGGDAGFAIAPRVGTKVLVGRSGLFNLFVKTQFTTNDYVQTPRGTLVAVSNSTTLGVGYSVMW